MAYFFYFRTDQKGHVVREADSLAVAANGQRQLAPNSVIAIKGLMQHYDSLRAKQGRGAATW